MCPFLTVDAVGEYDVKSDVIGGGHSGERLPDIWFWIPEKCQNIHALEFPLEFMVVLSWLTLS